VHQAGKWVATTSSAFQKGMISICIMIAAANKRPQGMHHERMQPRKLFTGQMMNATNDSVVGNKIRKRALFAAFSYAGAATSTATKMQAWLLLKRAMPAANDRDLGGVINVINPRIIKGAAMDFLKFTDDGLAVIRF
jgi:hypothetical protein